VNKGKGKRYLFDKRRNRRRVVHGLVALCLLLLGLDAFVHRHATHPWDSLFGFYALYGFVACVLLVLLAKELRKLVMRDPDYYQRTSRERGGRDGRSDEHA